MPALPSDSLIDVVEVLLKEINASVSRTSIATTLQHHPDYPSLFAVTDSLSHWKIENSPVRLTSAELSQARPPFIAHLKDNQLVVVTKIEPHQVSYFHTRPARDTTEAFVSRWSGISVLVSAAGRVREPDFLARRRAEHLRRLRLPALGLVVASALVVAGAGLGSALLASLLVTKLLGMVLCGLLVKSLAHDSTTLNSLCEASAKTSCKEVLHSSAAQLFGFIGLSDIGMVYFSGAGLALLAGLGLGRATEVATVLKGLSLASVVVVFFSVYYQAAVVRKWCVLCLGVMAVLLLDVVIFLLAGQSLALGEIQVLPVVVVVGALIGAASIWSYLQEFQETRVAGRTYRARYARLKNNPTVFQALLAASPSMLPTPAGAPEVVLGTPEAALHLVLVLSPYCAPCAAMVTELVQLLDDAGSKIRVSLRFSTFSVYEGEAKNQAILCFMELYRRLSKQDFTDALAFWYETMDMEAFLVRYPGLAEHRPHLPQLLENAVAWSIAANITHTPMAFVNNRKLPQNYALKDLRYFVN
ncbi:vitamin K epoxide reductase family protein [Hymenobacter convexus]|uniref:vitamin K epoxide reductase family protein n=1 Tax=Hymenobacter sp. CA1UV-4 TaxID=3063782 RepID=UPI002712E6B2|nr:vitamin K epoxide reductase family protein [Hymenobacter sp. CA1UV-4]MDO7851833.1 vitamin K epoxide reductase family protein [Hymenobacter sp. CA1UV-4]